MELLDRMDAPLRFILTTFGSAGDLMPLLSIGQTLQGRGHAVTVLTGGGFVDVVAKCGLDCVPLATPAFFERSLRDVFLLNTRYHGLFLKRYAVSWNAALLQYLSSASRANTIVLGAERPLVWADLCAHLHFGLSGVRMVTDLPPAPGVPANEGIISARLQSALAEKWQAGWSQAVYPLKIRPGHRHVARLTHASNRSVPRLAMWPDWMAPKAPRPAYLRNFGFVGSPQMTSAAAITRPSRRRPLLVFIAGTVGTTGNWEQRFAEVSRKICERLDCDGLLLGGTAPDGATESGSFTWRKHVPLDAVLPSATALIHHGGIGTAAAALQHGIPQLIVPRMFSQPSNARWMQRAGAAYLIAPEDYYPEEGARMVGTLVADDSVRNACMSWREKINPIADRSRICDFVEEWHRRRITLMVQPCRGTLRATA